MLFYYTAKTPEGKTKTGTIDAGNKDLAIAALQRRNLIIVSLESEEEHKPFYKRSFITARRVKERDVVIFSRQMATLFGAKVPVVDALRILVTESPNDFFRRHLTEVADDIQGGLPISQAMGRHPQIFSPFYVQMVRSGEEAGKLEDILNYLADYLERSYDLLSKARNALIYPAFVLVSFFVVMGLMLAVVIPRLSEILLESGQPIPLYTKIIIELSAFIRSFGLFFLILLALGIIFAWQYFRTSAGRMAFARLQLSVPIIGNLYRQVYLARFADNLQTLLSGGVTVARALEISADVVGNEVYRGIITEARNSVRGGSSISDALLRYEDIPSLVGQMIRIGEETGQLNTMLSTLARFYNREVSNSLERIVSLIEPVLIVSLGLGIGVLIVSILVPIYNISLGF